MMGVTFLALLLTQIDKILLSKFLPLSEYGYYVMAGVVASGLNMVITPITQAFYPRLVELSELQDRAMLNYTYHKGAQLVSVVAGSVALVIILFAETFLRVWSQDPDLAQRTATLLRVLMLGTLLNGLMHMPYMAQLAHGWTSLSVRINIVAVAVIVPGLLWVVPRFGAEGAAWVWVSLNAGYVLLGIHFMFRRILVTEKWRWYLQDVLVPLLVAAAVAGILAANWPFGGSNFADMTLLVLAAAVTLTSAVLSASALRQPLQRKIKSMIVK
jgi:O-antigen/teichoic acid export membrane protein